MNDQISIPDVSSSNDPLSPHKAPPAADALMRRRLLLRGATGGVAALAALKPIGALATSGSTVLVCKNGDGKDSLCTLSGVQSAAHSFGPNITPIQAAGKRPLYWSARTGKTTKFEGTPNNAWPSACVTTCAPGKTVGSLLVGCNSSYTSTKMLDLLNSKADSIEAHFIVAYLNATLYYNAGGPTSAKSFPYSNAQVKAFWDAAGTTRTNAENLFKSIATLT